MKSFVTASIIFLCSACHSLEQSTSTFSFNRGEKYSLKGYEKSYSSTDKFKLEGEQYSLNFDFNVEVLDVDNGEPVRNLYHVNKLEFEQGGKSNTVIARSSSFACSKEQGTMRFEPAIISPNLAKVLMKVFFCLGSSDEGQAENYQFAFGRMKQAFPKKVVMGQVYKLNPRPFYLGSPAADEFDEFKVELLVTELTNTLGKNCISIKLSGFASKQEAGKKSCYNQAVVVSSLNGHRTDWLEVTHYLDAEDNSSSEKRYNCQKHVSTINFEGSKDLPVYYDINRSKVVFLSDN